MPRNYRADAHPRMRHGTVAVILHPSSHKVLWMKRDDVAAWQFPGGGVDRGETEERAVWREVHEETGLTDAQLTLLGASPSRVDYAIPESMRQRRYLLRRRIAGQSQRWFLFRLRAGGEAAIAYDTHSAPEFVAHTWVSYWYPVAHIVAFKREAYRQGLLALRPHLR